MLSASINVRLVPEDDRWDDFLQPNCVLHHSRHCEHAACAWHHRHSNSGGSRRSFATHRWQSRLSPLCARDHRYWPTCDPRACRIRRLCCCRTLRWPSTLEAKFPEAVGFYTIISAATVIGFAVGFLPINPIQLLVWTAVINGIVAAPIMAVMMLIVTNPKAMGRFRARPSLVWAGWGATALMGITVAALLRSLLS